MPHLISYAQNGEDIVLHRALRHIEQGTYIDVGAYDPSYDSVTKLFYDRGWSGINVEPSKEMFERLARERPRDRNLNIALSDRVGELAFYCVERTGLSTLDPDVAEEARAGGFAVEERRVAVNTLADICRIHARGDIHFLKIDVEGAERAVLAGADLRTIRPWIIVVEATKPGTAERVDDRWRDVLDIAGYDSVLFDGLNLFWLARERSDLRPSLSAPANVTDRYVPASLHAAMLRLDARPAPSSEGSEFDDRSDELREMVRWNVAVARETLEAQVAVVRETLEGQVAVVRENLEQQAAVARENLERQAAVARKNLERQAAVAQEKLERQVDDYRRDYEATRRSMEETITWHRADAVNRALRSGADLSDRHLRELLNDERRAKTQVEGSLAALQGVHFDLTARLEAFEVELAEFRSRQDEVVRLEQANRELQAWHTAVRASTSWRLTRPLRVIVRLIKQISGAVRKLSV